MNISDVKKAIDYGETVAQALADWKLKRKADKVRLLVELATLCSEYKICEVATEKELLNYFEGLSTLGLITFTQTMQPRELAKALLNKISAHRYTETGLKCRSCGEIMSADCPKCQKDWET